jgi:ATP synthase protein I
MNKNPETSSNSRDSDFSRRIGAIESRKLEANRKGVQGVWFGLGLFGLIGWAVAIPTFLGALLGAFIDKRYPGVISWTLSLLIIGLFLGCLNAWHWVAKEEKAIREDEGEKDE